MLKYNDQYGTMLKLACQDRNLQVLPKKITVDFKLGLLQAVKLQFPCNSKDPGLLLSLFTVNLEEGIEAGATDNISRWSYLQGLCLQNGGSIFLSPEVPASSMNGFESWSSRCPLHRETTELFWKHLKERRIVRMIEKFDSWDYTLNEYINSLSKWMGFK